MPRPSPDPQVPATTAPAERVRTRPLRAVWLGFVAFGMLNHLLQLGRYGPEDDIPISALVPAGWSGPLASYVVSRHPDRQPSCRADDCTVAVVMPRATPAAGDWQLPASAVVEDAEGARVWIVFNDMAVPVSVRVVQREGVSLTVQELADARGLPLRAADWRALSSHGRYLLYRATHDVPQGRPASLLGAGAAVIRQPDTLRPPGTKVRAGT